MSAVLLKTTPGILVTPETVVDDTLLNQLGNPQVEIPEGANIGPSQLDMSSIGAALGVGATGSNLVLWGDFYPTGWREASSTANAGVRTENARNFWVKPAGASIVYARQQEAPDTLSAWSAYLGGNTGLTAVECGTYLGPDATSKLNEVPFVVSVSIKNQGNIAFRPTLEIRTSNVLQDEDAVTVRITDQAADQVAVGNWRRYTWTLNSTGLTNWLLGAQIVFKLEPFLSASFSVLVSQIDVRRGTAAAAFSVAPRETIAAGAVPVGTMLALAGSQSVPDTGFLFCNGAAVSRSTYGNLFSKLGTQYGVGNGLSTFNLPDMRERKLVGCSSMGNVLVGAGRAGLEVAGCSTSSGSQILTLGSATNVPIGSLVVANGVPLGTQVIGADDNTTVYLSAAATATATGTLNVVLFPGGADLRTAGAVTPDNQAEFEARYGTRSIFHRLGTGANGNRLLQVNLTGLGYAVLDLYVGMEVIAPFIPPGTVIESFHSYQTLYLSANKTAAMDLDPVSFAEPSGLAERLRWRQRAALEPVIRECSTTNASLTVTVPQHMTRVLLPGMRVSGTGVPAGATIANLVSSTTFQLSAPATSTGGGRILNFSAPPEYLSTPIYRSEMNCLWQIKV